MEAGYNLVRMADLVEMQMLWLKLVKEKRENGK